MRRLSRHVIAPALTIALFGGMALHMQPPSRAGIDAWHAQMRATIEDVPMRIGEWVGHDVPMPPSAIALLKPNALLARRYVNEQTGHTADLVIIQCRDMRDMTGHYPPVCYPAHGWTPAGEPEQVTLVAGREGDPLVVTHYTYTRSALVRAQRTSIYGCFALPARGIAQDMAEVRDAASDYRERLRGAAQLQVVVSGALPLAEQRQIANQLFGAIRPEIDALASNREVHDAR